VLYIHEQDKIMLNIIIQPSHKYELKDRIYEYEKSFLCMRMGANATGWHSSYLMVLGNHMQINVWAEYPANTPPIPINI